jgi:hypothetical protein
MKPARPSAFVSLVALAWGCSSEDGPKGVSGGAGTGGGTPAAGAGTGGGSPGGAGSGGTSAGSGAGATGGATASGGTGDGGTSAESGAAGATVGGAAGEGGGAGQSAGAGGAGAGGDGSGGAGAGGGAGTGAGMSGAGAGGSTGGSAGASGSSSGGSAGASGSGGAVTPLPGMSFFVTSKGTSKGGNLGSLEAADAFCKELATAVSSTLGQKTWRAYLSTSNVDARDRIGTGPWRNQAGVVVANDLAELHQQEQGQALDATWPPGDLTIALDETGGQVPNDVHDILTGTNADGTKNSATCNDWTSESSSATAQVGHSNRTGGGRPPYFNATHTVGCAPSATNRAQGTVTSGGGRGSLYCFALEPSSGP